MDQDTTKGSDKRNWRERLGIGAANGQSASGARDLPKIGDDFRKDGAPNPRPASAGAAPSAPRPAAPKAAAPAVKPAPMAPRPAAKPAGAPVPQDKLAEKLRAQREASARMAEHRVQVARQRADVAAPAAAPAAPQSPASAPAAARVVPPAKPAVAPVAAKPAAPADPRPKFTFAEEEVPPAPPPPPAFQPRATVPPPQTARPAAPMPPQMPPPPLTPARPPLGVNAGMQRPAPGFGATPPMPQAPQGYPPPPVFNPAGLGQQPIPPYRPIDPATGYPQAGGMMPPGRPAYPPQQPAPPAGGFAPQPRLNVPQAPSYPPNYPPNYPPQGDFGAGPGGYAPEPRLNPGPRMGRPVARASSYADDPDAGLFDEAPSRGAGRRPSSVDYQQAYREAEAGFEDEPRSKGPWIFLLLMLLVAALAGGTIWYYTTKLKPMMAESGQSTESVPVVDAPAQPAKAQPEQTQTEQSAGQANRKQIYDRIVGDREVPGGTLVPTEETPAAPADGGNAIPQPAGTTGQPSGVDGTGEEAAPLPIPPPPGNTDTQGALPSDKADQPNQIASSAAGESQAAVAAPAPGEPVPAAGAPSIAPASATGSNATGGSASTDQGQEQIADTPEPAPAAKPVERKKPAAKPKPKVAAQDKMENLGSKPVVLVPPSKKAKAAADASTEAQVASIDSMPANSGGGGLYDGEGVVASPPVNTAPAAVQQPKKKRTIADLFNNSGEADVAANAPATTAPSIESVPEVPAPAPKPVQQPRAAAPKPVQEASASPTGYSVQLASFASRQEAQAEYSRLKSKYASAVGGYAPIINEATVGGSTRYRLGIGSMASREQANAVCTKLFAAGVRDCLVRGP